MNLEPITDETEFKRDVTTGSVVHSNDIAFRAYLKTKEKSAAIESQVKELKQNMEEIKEMMKVLLQQSNRGI